MDGYFREVESGDGAKKNPSEEEEEEEEDERGRGSGLEKSKEKNLKMKGVVGATFSTFPRKITFSTFFP